MKEQTSPAKRYGAQIRERLNRWNELNVNGGTDPFWEDGVNMELVRNHILYYRRKCEEELQPSEYPEEYFLEIPPEVDRHYMAKAAEIPGKAKEALSIMEQNQDYRYLLSVVTRLDAEAAKQIHISTIIGYVTGTRAAIESGNLVEMRRKTYYQTYLDSFRDCRRKCEELLREPEVKEYPDGYQLTLFDVCGLA